MSDNKFEITELAVHEVSTVRNPANLETDFILVKGMETKLDPKAPETVVEKSEDLQIVLDKLAVFDGLAESLSGIQKAISGLVDAQEAQLAKSGPKMVQVTKEGKVLVEGKEIEAVSKSTQEQVEKALEALQLAKDNSVEGKLEKTVADAVEVVKSNLEAQIEELKKQNEAMNEFINKLRETSESSNAEEDDTELNKGQEDVWGDLISVPTRR